MHAVPQLLDLLSEFSTIRKVSNGNKVAKYFIPNLIDCGLPDIQKIKKLTGATEVQILAQDEHQIVLIYRIKI